MVVVLILRDLNLWAIILGIIYFGRHNYTSPCGSFVKLR